MRVSKLRPAKTSLTIKTIGLLKAIINMMIRHSTS